MFGDCVREKLNSVNPIADYNFIKSIKRSFNLIHWTIIMRRRLVAILSFPIIVFIFFTGWMVYYIGRQQKRLTKETAKKSTALEMQTESASEEEMSWGTYTQQDLNQALNVVNLKASMKKMKGELLYASCANSTTHTFTKEKNVTHSSLSKFDLITLEDTLTNRRMNT